MKKLQSQEIEQIAMHYMKINSKPGDTAEHLCELYLSADEAIHKAESDATNKHIADPGWGL